MALILPEEPSASATSIAGNNIRIAKREIRPFYKEPVPDRVELEPNRRSLNSGEDLDVTVRLFTDLGTKAKVDLLDVTLNIIDSVTVNSDQTITFNNVSSDVHYIQGYIQDSGNRMVSRRTDVPITVDSNAPHPNLASHYETGSERDLTKKQEEFQLQTQNDLNEGAGIAFDIYQGKDDECNRVERHIDLIVSLEVGYNGNDPVQDSDVTNSASLGDTRLYPSGYNGDSPQHTNWIDGIFSNNAQTVLYYSSPNSSKSPSNLSEKQELQSADPTQIGGATVFDESRGQDYTYGTVAEVNERIQEINDLIDGGPLEVSERSGINELASSTDGFNNASATTDLFDSRYTWIDFYTNHASGLKFLYNEMDVTDNKENTKEQQVDNIVSEIGT